MYMQDLDTSIPAGFQRSGPGSSRYRDRSPSLDSFVDVGHVTSDSVGNMRILDTVGEGSSTKSPTVTSFGAADTRGVSYRGNMGMTVSETRANKVKTMRNNLNPPVPAHMHTTHTVGLANFSRPNLHPGQQTPKCASGSRGSSSDPAKFNTPQGDAGPTLSGNGDNDWGTSEGAPDAVIMQMRARMEGLKAKYSQEFSQPGLFRAHSTGYIEMRSDRTSTGSNMSASSRGSNGFFSSRGVLRDSGSGSQSCMPQGGGYSGDLALSPAFPPVPIGLLRSVSHAGKLEDTTLSPNDSPGDRPDECSGDGGIAMGGAESLLGESPQSYNPLSGATSFGATFPQSTQKLTGPRPAYASSKDGFLSAFSPPLTEQQQRQHQSSGGLGGGEGSAFGAPSAHMTGSLASSMDEVAPQGAITDDYQSVHSFSVSNMPISAESGRRGGVKGRRCKSRFFVSLQSY